MEGDGKLIAQKLQIRSFKVNRNKLGIKNVFNYYGMVEQNIPIFLSARKDISILQYSF